MENQTPTRRDDLISVIYAILALILGALPWDIKYSEYIKSPEGSAGIKKIPAKNREEAKKMLYDEFGLKMKRMEPKMLFNEFDIYDEYLEICKIYEHLLKLKPQEDPNYDIIDVSIKSFWNQRRRPKKLNFI